MSNRTVQGVGAGVDAFGKPVVIVGSKITLKHAANAGGGVAVSDNTLRLTKSTVANNVAEEGATGVYLYQAQGGSPRESAATSPETTPAAASTPRPPRSS